MYKWLYRFIRLLIGSLKFGLLKLCNLRTFHSSFINLISPGTEITIDRHASLNIGNIFNIRGGCKLCVREDARVVIGKDFSMGNFCMIVSHEKIIIGNHVMFGPGVLVYDHDHDYKHPRGISAHKFQTSPIRIGNNVWIGANTIILRGTEIGDNCVVAAGTIVKGSYPANSLIYQKRNVNHIFYRNQQKFK